MPAAYCASIPHPQFLLSVHHCPHVGEYIAYITTMPCASNGDDYSTSEVRFGPFDTRQDVVDFLVGVVVEGVPLPPG